MDREPILPGEEWMGGWVQGVVVPSLKNISSGDIDFSVHLSSSYNYVGSRCVLCCPPDFSLTRACFFRRRRRRHLLLAVFRQTTINRFMGALASKPDLLLVFGAVVVWNGALTSAYAMWAQTRGQASVAPSEVSHRIFFCLVDRFPRPPPTGWR